MMDSKLIGILVAADFAFHLGKKMITEEILEAIAHYPPIIMNIKLLKASVQWFNN